MHYSLNYLNKILILIVLIISVQANKIFFVNKKKTYYFVITMENVYFSSLSFSDCFYRIKTDEETDEFQALAIVTKEMVAVMDAWSEIVFIDSTYQLLELGYPAPIFVIEDGNGATEIVCFSLVTHEDESTMKWVIEVFFEIHASAFPRIEVFMADKDMVARKILKDTYGFVVYICAFHVH